MNLPAALRSIGGVALKTPTRATPLSPPVITAQLRTQALSATSVAVRNRSLTLSRPVMIGGALVSAVTVGALLASNDGEFHSSVSALDDNGTKELLTVMSDAGLPADVLTEQVNQSIELFNLSESEADVRSALEINRGALSVKNPFNATLGLNQADYAAMTVLRDAYSHIRNTGMSLETLQILQQLLAVCAPNDFEILESEYRRLRYGR